MDLLKKFFAEQQNESWQLIKEEVIKYITGLSDSFVMQEIPLNINDLIAKSKDESYRSDLKVSIIDNGVELIYTSLDIWNEIKDYIPRSIKSLTLPGEIIENDYEYLKNFPSLVELNCDSYRLTPEILSFLGDNTNIKTINCQFMFVLGKEYSQMDNMAYADFPIKKIYYRDSVVNDCSEFDREHHKWLQVYMANINTLLLDKIMNQQVKYDTLTIYTLNGKIIVKFNKQHDLITELITNNISLEEAKIIFDFLHNKFNISNMLVDIQNTDYISNDHKPLNYLSQRTNLKIKYSEASMAEYEDFVNMIETIKWYRELINGFNLSPVEKVMYAYDIMKTFKYRENEEDKSMARYPDKILKQGDIVCVGYANFLIEILKGIDPGIGITSDSVTCYDKDYESYIGHERNIVRIDDDKYNIHGVFILDATWDSDRKGSDDKIPEEYTSLDLYNYFLIPYEDYSNTFQYDTIPIIYRYYEQIGKDNIPKQEMVKYGDWGMKKITDELFGPLCTEEQLIAYLKSSRPSIEDFYGMLYNVRIAEGYKPDEAIKAIGNVNAINELVIAEKRQNGESIKFF